MLKYILKNFNELNLHLHLSLTDFKQAYGSINRRYLQEIFKDFGVQKKLLDLIKIVSGFKLKGKNPTSIYRSSWYSRSLEKVIRNIECKMNGTVFKERDII
jgi:hypothetical protein